MNNLIRYDFTPNDYKNFLLHFFKGIPLTSTKVKVELRLTDVQKLSLNSYKKENNVRIIQKDSANVFDIKFPRGFGIENCENVEISCLLITLLSSMYKHICYYKSFHLRFDLESLVENENYEKVEAVLNSEKVDSKVINLTIISDTILSLSDTIDTSNLKKDRLKYTGERVEYSSVYPYVLSDRDYQGMKFKKVLRRPSPLSIPRNYIKKAIYIYPNDLENLKKEISLLLKSFSFEQLNVKVVEFGYSKKKETNEEVYKRQGLEVSLVFCSVYSYNKKIYLLTKDCKHLLFAKTLGYLNINYKINITVKGSLVIF